jgi:hypothetical protein
MRGRLSIGSPPSSSETRFRRTRSADRASGFSPTREYIGSGPVLSDSDATSSSSGFQGTDIPDALTHGGYHIVDVKIGGLVAGWGNAGRGYALDLDGVEDWVKEQPR